MSSYFRLEDTREEQVVMVDPEEMWEKVIDCLPKELREFVEDAQHNERVKFGVLMRENQLLREKLEGRHD